MIEAEHARPDLTGWLVDVEVHRDDANEEHGAYVFRFHPDAPTDGSGTHTLLLTWAALWEEFGPCYVMVCPPTSEEILYLKGRMDPREIAEMLESAANGDFTDAWSDSKPEVLT
jgi:hypothetical protein